MNKLHPTDWLIVVGASVTLVLGIGIILAVIFGSMNWAHGQPLPVPKTGQCAAGFLTSGAYCTPAPTERRQAIPKVGQCPANWIQSGNYCLSPGR